MSEGLCLDTGALIAVERRDRRVIRLIEVAFEFGRSVSIPAPVVAQAWRGGAKQARLARLLASVGVETIAMDGFVARAVGELCAATGATDVVDAHVAWHAYSRDLTVVTSDPDDLAAFGLGVPIVAI